MMRLCLLSSLVVGATAATPCSTEDLTCTRAPCPAPPPDLNERCVVEPNPLVIGQDGKCCPRSMCDTYSCPSDNGCQCDGAGDYSTMSMFCDDNMPTARSHFFDCSQSPAGNACFKSISPEASQCDCLVTNCTSHTHLLLAESNSSCVLACESPAPLNSICPNYDDQHDWCSYYAFWMCVTEEDTCTSKPTMSEAEKTCIAQAAGKTPSDRLDSFLICLGQSTSKKSQEVVLAVV